MGSQFSHPANMTEAKWFLREWRMHRGLSQQTLADAVETSKGYVSDVETGKRPIPRGLLVEKLAAALGVSTGDLYRHPDDGPGGERLVRIIGTVGADTEGTVIQSTGQEAYDMAPIPPGGTSDSVALEVKGHSMRAIAEDGALIYFEDQRNPPTPDMIGYVCIVELEDGRVLIKRLLRGSAADLYMLESQVGPPLEDVRIRWAAEPTAIIPAKQARRIIRRAGEVQAA